MALKFQAGTGLVCDYTTVDLIFVSFIKSPWQPARYYFAERERESCCGDKSHSQSGTPQMRQRSLLRTPCFIIASPVLRSETQKFVSHTLLHCSQSGTPQRYRNVCCAHPASLQPVRYFAVRQRSLLRTPCFIIASPVLRSETKKFSAHTLLLYSQSGTPQ